jgi:hypothetical protein
MISLKNIFGKKETAVQQTLANMGKPTQGKRVLEYTKKAVSIVRQDIKTYKEARQAALSDEPKNYAVQLIYNDAILDALMTSQIENRKNQIFSIDFKLKNKAGEVDEEQTLMLKKLPAYRKLLHAVLDSKYYGYNLIELSLVKRDDGTIDVDVSVIPRTNVVPQTGLFYPDYSEDKNIKYREMAEFGIWILEFNSGDLGLLNKAVPHVLFKRFAQSCWSELCEICGIPPRFLKTNTQDPAMLKRAEAMMSDLGAAPWFIIDESESFEFAKTDGNKGEVYQSLITLCNNEISLLVSGAIIGQDTVNGNRSKEQSSQDMLWELVKSDMALFEEKFNTIILPALIKIGILKGEVVGEFEPAPDLDSLWKYTQGILNSNYSVDANWLKTTFGVEVTGEKTTAPANSKQTLSIEAIFD